MTTRKKTKPDHLKAVWAILNTLNANLEDIARSLAKLRDSRVSDALMSIDEQLGSRHKQDLASRIFSGMAGRLALAGPERTPEEVTLLAMRARQYATVFARVFFDGAEIDEATLATEQAKQVATEKNPLGVKDAPAF